jgi:hypothetical protein
LANATDEERFEAFLDEARWAQTLWDDGKFTQANRIRRALKNQGFDWQKSTWKSKSGEIFQPSAVGAGPTSPGEPPSTGGGTSTGTTDEWLRDLYPDAALQDLLKGEHGARILEAMALEDFIKGRTEGEETLRGGLSDFEDDPLVAALQGRAEGLLEDPDILSEDDISKMLGVQDMRLSQSFQNDAAGLANTLGGRNIGADSGVGQELAAALRFATLQEGAAGETELRTSAAQLNRQGLIDAMRMGLGTSDYIQGTRNQFLGGIANMQAGMPLANFTSSGAAFAAATGQGKGTGVDRGENIWNMMGADFAHQGGSKIIDKGLDAAFAGAGL